MEFSISEFYLCLSSIGKDSLFFLSNFPVSLALDSNNWLNVVLCFLKHRSNKYFLGMTEDNGSETLCSRSFHMHESKTPFSLSVFTCLLYGRLLEHFYFSTVASIISHSQSLIFSFSKNFRALVLVSSILMDVGS